MTENLDSLSRDALKDRYEYCLIWLRKLEAFLVKNFGEKPTFIPITFGGYDPMQPVAWAMQELEAKIRKQERTKKAEIVIKAICEAIPFFEKARGTSLMELAKECEQKAPLIPAEGDQKRTKRNAYHHQK